MTNPQVSRVARARRKEQLRGTARERPQEDPQLRRMLISHIHCGQEMQLFSTYQALPDERTAARNENSLLTTYRCACGFSFDQRQDDWPVGRIAATPFWTGTETAPYRPASDDFHSAGEL